MVALSHQTKRLLGDVFAGIALAYIVLYFVSSAFAGVIPLLAKHPWGDWGLIFPGVAVPFLLASGLLEREYCPHCDMRLVAETAHRAYCPVHGLV